MAHLFIGSSSHWRDIWWDSSVACHGVSWSPSSPHYRRCPSSHWMASHLTLYPGFLGISFLCSDICWTVSDGNISWLVHILCLSELIIVVVVVVVEVIVVVVIINPW